MTTSKREQKTSKRQPPQGRTVDRPAGSGTLLARPSQTCIIDRETAERAVAELVAALKSTDGEVAVSAAIMLLELGLGKV